MALLCKMGIIGSSLSITMMRREIYHFIFMRDNSENAMKLLDKCVTFRDGDNREKIIQLFLKRS